MRDPDMTRLFMQVFQERLSQHSSVHSAYHHAELYWRDNFGQQFYKNYSSFRSAKCQYFRKVRIASSSPRSKTC